MRSEYAEVFNHDEDAATYDNDVRDERDPIRAGYEALLSWVATTAAVQPEDRVLELGSGTGNLTAKLPGCREIVCVDISARMQLLAKPKLEAQPITWVTTDLLDVFAEGPPGGDRFDAIVSTYAIHHLTAEERAHLLTALASSLDSTGRCVVGDLMFADAAARQTAIERYRQNGASEVVEAIEEEFFWLLDETRRAADQAKLTFNAKQFSDLSWGVILEPQ